MEFIHSILQNIGYRDFTTKQARIDGLKVIAQLFDLDLIEIFHWGNHQNVLNGIKLDKSEIIKIIGNIWFVGADYSDFMGMSMFRHKDWYVEALKREGLKLNGMDWKTFVEEKIGNIEKWIEKNRPGH